MTECGDCGAGSGFRKEHAPWCSTLIPKPEPEPERAVDERRNPGTSARTKQRRRAQQRRTKMAATPKAEAEFIEVYRVGTKMRWTHTSTPADDPYRTWGTREAAFADALLRRRPHQRVRYRSTQP